MEARKVIISLCDFSGNWAMPFAEVEDYLVILVDPKHPMQGTQNFDSGGSVLRWGFTVEQFLTYLQGSILRNRTYYDIVGIIAQPVCTQFAGSGARWWKEKDAKEPQLLEDALALVKDCLKVIDMLQPHWWVMENPVGRLGRLLMGPPVMTYQPHEFAGWLGAEERDEERYTKRTCLWGTFDVDALQRHKWDLGDLHGSKMWANYGGRSDATKEARSMTPKGFARAFWEAHKYLQAQEQAA